LLSFDYVVLDRLGRYAGFKCWRKFELWVDLAGGDGAGDEAGVCGDERGAEQ